MSTHASIKIITLIFMDTGRIENREIIGEILAMPLYMTEQQKHQAVTVLCAEVNTHH